MKLAARVLVPHRSLVRTVRYWHPCVQISGCLALSSQLVVLEGTRVHVATINNHVTVSATKNSRFSNMKKISVFDIPVSRLQHRKALCGDTKKTRASVLWNRSKRIAPLCGHGPWLVNDGPAMAVNGNLYLKVTITQRLSYPSPHLRLYFHGHQSNTLSTFSETAT